MLKCVECRTDYLENPIGIDDMQPRFSWKLESDRHGVMQVSYRVYVRRGSEIVWDSQEVVSSDSQQITYQGLELRSAETYQWTVSVTAEGDDGVRESAQSGEHTFEMGLLNRQEWQASWIAMDEETDVNRMMPVQYFRKSFALKKSVKKARVYQTAHGLYEFWLNGNPGTQDKFKPGFTSYYSRLQYQTYDITEYLHKGLNVWAIALADGWWRGVTGGDIRNNFGTTLAFLGQMVIEYEDGTIEVIRTDESFRTATGGFLASDMKLGDIYDARLEPAGWKEPGFMDSDWKPAVKMEGSLYGIENLIASNSVPVREMERLSGQVMQDAEGSLVIDFGQNIAGYVAMTFRNLKEGQHITVEFAEDFKDGAFYNENIPHGTPIPGLERFQQIDYYAVGKEEERYTPMFSVFGFQYIRIRGYEETIQAEDFTAVAVYSACRETGEFTCSNRLINQLVQNSRWSQKGNFLDVPTDCPTRERSPWTGDSQIYARTAGWFTEVYPFFEKWMKDVSADQCENGKILNIAPNCMMPHDVQAVEAIKRMASEQLQESAEGDAQAAIMNMLYAQDGAYVLDGSAGWGDTATITPWTMYQRYGDVRILENQYESAKKWVDYMIANAKNPNPLQAEQPWYTKNEGADAEYIWDTRYHWGEWLEPDRENEAMKGVEAITKPDPEVPTAFLCYSSRLLSQMAEALGKMEDAERYHVFSEKVKAAYDRYFISEDGVIKEGRQAPQVRTLAFGLCSEDKRGKVAKTLNDLVVKNGYHLNTGFLSTAELLNVLSDNGYVDTAYKLILQEECPGWLYNVKAGATTIPETWDGKKTHKDSMNHYSYGAVCDFLFSRCAGIEYQDGTAGFATFLLKPVPDDSLEYAQAEYESPYGKVVSKWERTGNGISYHFEVPCNTQAKMLLPDGRSGVLKSGVYDI